MTDSTVSGDIAKEMANLLGRFADRGKAMLLSDEIPGQPNSYGVYTLWSKTRQGIVVFAFMTSDDLRLDVEFDFNLLAEHGKGYIDGMIQDVRDQLLEARQMVFEDRSITVFETKEKGGVEGAVKRSLVLPGNDSVN